MFSDPVSVASTAFAFRIGERIALSAIIILVALVVTLGFWRSIQKLDFTLAKGGMSGGGNFVLATPVFALLALIAFAWVSFAHPITVSVPTTTAPDRQAETAQAVGTVTMAGALPTPQGDIDFARHTVRMRILSLNCVAQKAGGGLAARDGDALEAVKVALLRSVWDPAWGDPAALEAWATGLSTSPPDPEVRTIFEAVHPLC